MSDICVLKRDGLEQLEPVLEIHKDKDGLLYISKAAKPSFVFTGETLDECISKAKKAMDWYEEDGA